MTDRRRNLFILLLVFGLLAGSLVVIATKPTRLGLDLKGGVSLVYQAKPTKQSTVNGDAIQRTLDIMRERVDQLGVAEPEIQRSGSDQIDVALPDVKNADEAAQPGRHDGPDVLLRLGDERPRRQLQAGAGDANVTGGSAGRRRAPARSTSTRRSRARPSARRATPATRRRTAALLPRRHEGQEGPRRARTRRAGTCAQESREQGIKPGPGPEGRRGQAAARSSCRARVAETSKTKSDRFYVMRTTRR